MVVDLNCVDMTVNLQTWVMLLDFMTFSSTSSEKVVRGSQAVSDFLHDMSDSSKTTEFRVSSTGDVTLIRILWCITYRIDLCHFRETDSSFTSVLLRSMLQLTFWPGAVLDRAEDLRCFLVPSF